MGPLLLVATAALAGPHDDSVSFSRVEVEATTLTVELRVQALSVVEVLPWMDSDGDQLLSEAELASRPAELGGYVLEHYRLHGDGLALRPEAFPVAVHDPAAIVPGTWAVLTWSVPLEAAPRELVLEVDLFLEGSPGHLEFTEVCYRGVDLPAATLGPGGGRWSYVAPTRWEAASRSLAGLRGRSFLQALLLLAAALACAGPRPLALAGAGLGGVALGLVWVRFGAPLPPARPLELAAILGAAYVAADLALLPRRRAPWVEAWTFGLLLGMAHGREAAQRLASELHAGWRVLVEVGTTGTVALLLAALVARTVQGGARRGVAGALALLGLVLFAARVAG